MRTRQTISVVAIVLVAVTGVMAPAFAAPQVDGAASVADRADDGKAVAGVLASNETTNDTSGDSTNQTAPLGSQISAFMQSTSVSANSSVETGMWVARFESADETNKSTMIDRRAAVLETRLERLRAQLESMNDSGDSILADVRQAGRVASLTARINALETTLNRTSTVATEAGVNHTRLATLKQNASDLNGQAVATVARGLTVVEVPGRGPPEDRPGGPPEDKPGGPPDEKPGGQSDDNSTGPPDEKPGGQSDDNSTGPPEENPGNSSGGDGSPTGEETSNGTGPDDASQSGSADTGANGSQSGSASNSLMGSRALTTTVADFSV